MHHRSTAPECQNAWMVRYASITAESATVHVDGGCCSAIACTACPYASTAATRRRPWSRTPPAAVPVSCASTAHNGTLTGTMTVAIAAFPSVCGWRWRTAATAASVALACFTMCASHSSTRPRMSTTSGHPVAMTPRSNSGTSSATSISVTAFVLTTAMLDKRSHASTPGHLRYLRHLPMPLASRAPRSQHTAAPRQVPHTPRARFHDRVCSRGCG